MYLEDRDILTDLLIDVKTLSNNYHSAVLEAANDRVRNALIQINNDKLHTHKQIFDLMHSRGWYPLDPAYKGTPIGAYGEHREQEKTGFSPQAHS